MTSPNGILRLGGEESTLASGAGALASMQALLPGLRLETRPIAAGEAPGPPDHFDCALRIAASLPDTLRETLDWFWLPPLPEEEVLALIFRAGDERLLRLRSLFVRAVAFVGAGVGSADLCTLAGLRELRRAEVCIHDSRLDPSLLDELPSGARRIEIDKPHRGHGLEQAAISRLIALEARRGRRVLRLKGGDPGIFGRLSEEVETLDALHLPYFVLPGVSSLTAATTATGMLLTRRGVSRGFCALTPRQAGGGQAPVTGEARVELPIVLFMAVDVLGEVASRLIADGTAPDTPAALVFGAGGDEESIFRGALSDIASLVDPEAESRPGLLIVGEAARHGFCRDWGALQGRSVLLTCSDAILEKAAALVSDFGGRPLKRPMVRMVPRPEAADRLSRIGDYDWLVLSSPSAARIFGLLAKEARLDLRSLPRIMACGPGTAREVEELGLKPDLVPNSDFGVAGMVEVVRRSLPSGARVLHLRSDKAGDTLAVELRGLGLVAEDCILYQNEVILYERLPAFDAIFFASASAVEAFEDQRGLATLEGVIVAAIGRPTIEALKARGITAGAIGREATVESCLRALAALCVGRSLRDIMSQGTIQTPDVTIPGERG
jgi:uroporphyrinogen III methyltransferase/synthase